MKLLPLVVLLVNDLPPEVQGKINTLANWLVTALAWGAGAAFVVVGAIFCYAYFGGHGSSRAVRALAGVSVGSLLLSVGSGIAGTLTGVDGVFNPGT